MSLNVSLPPELETRVRQRVESGMYGSASDVYIGGRLYIAGEGFYFWIPEIADMYFEIDPVITPVSIPESATSTQSGGATTTDPLPEPSVSDQPTSTTTPEIGTDIMPVATSTEEVVKTDPL